MGVVSNSPSHTAVSAMADDSSRPRALRSDPSAGTRPEPDDLLPLIFNGGASSFVFVSFSFEESPARP